MMPAILSSLVHDVALTPAGFSGGAFDDSVQGPGHWRINGATPAFETRAGIDGMLFTGSPAEAVIAPFLALHEATIVVIAQPATASQPALIGGTYPAGNSWRLYPYGATLRCFAPPAKQVVTAVEASMTTRASVFSGAMSPRTGRLYARINDGPLAVSEGNGLNARINWAEAAIGQHRNSHFAGWIARVLVFSRCLPDRDPAAFDAVIADQLATIAP